jgi:hypothetical protein
LKIEIKEMSRASEGDVIELEGKVTKAIKPNSNDFEGKLVWSQFIVLKDETGEQGCWLKLDSENDKVPKGISLKIKGKVGKEYEDSKGAMKRSLNNCTFEGDKKEVGSTQDNGGNKDDYWNKKLELDLERFEWDKKRDLRNQMIIARECAFKAATELVCAANVEGATFDKIFTLSDKIKGHYFKDREITNEDIVKEFGGITKEERIEKAREVVGDTEFKPATTLQKNKIFGYRDEKGWHKGIIESRFITKEEIREIGSPEKLSVEKASKWLGFWWGLGDEIGERAKREIEAQGQEDESREVVDSVKESLSKKESILKGNKTSVAKDILVDEVYSLRRENLLNDDEKFEKEMGYSSNLKALSEKDLLLLKEILKHWHPKNWDKEEVNPV